MTIVAEVEIPFAVQSAPSASPQNSQERLINMHAVIEPSGRKTPSLIRKQRHGMVTLQPSGTSDLDIGTVDDSALIQIENRCIEQVARPGSVAVFPNSPRFEPHYAVFGRYLFLLDHQDNADVLVTVGMMDGTGGRITLNTDSGRCMIIGNDSLELLVSDGTNGYYRTGAGVTGVLSHSEDVDTLAFIGGYGIMSTGDSGSFYITDLNDFTTVDPLNFATAEFSPDILMRVFADHGELYLFGRRTTEVWALTGGLDFPFSPISNANMTTGIGSAKYSVTAAEGVGVCWLGHDKKFYRAEGYRPVPISNAIIDRRVAELTDAQIDTCEGFTFANEDGRFMVWRFKGVMTILFNATTGLWSDAQTYGYPDWRIIGSSTGGESAYYLTGNSVVRLRKGVSTDESSTTMVRKAISAPAWADGRRITMNSLTLDIEVGRTAPFDRSSIGGAAGTVTEPEIMLRVALDGESFGNERVRSLGAEGKYNKRVVWRNLGQGRKPVLELSVSDPTVEVKILGAIADIEVEA